MGHFLPRSLEDIGVFNSLFNDQKLARFVMSDISDTNSVDRRREFLNLPPSETNSHVFTIIS